MSVALMDALSVQSTNAGKFSVPRSNAPNSPKIHTVHYYADSRLRQKSQGEGWTEDEYRRLSRLVITYHIATPHRWKHVPAGLAQNPSPSGDEEREKKEKKQADLDKRNANKKSKESVELEQCYYCHGCGSENKKPWKLKSDDLDADAQLPDSDVCVNCGTANVTRSPEECFMQLPILYLKYKDKVKLTDDEVKFKKKVGTIFSNLTVALGKETSQEERQENGLFGEEFCYGEFDIQVFIQMFFRIKRIFGHMPADQNGVFWDLGSGTGKLVVAAAALHPFSQCWGIEKLRSLDRIGAQLMTDYMKSEEYKAAVPSMRETQMRCICADILTTDAWVENTTVCIIHSSCFSDKMMEVVRDKATTMNVGCIMVTVTKPLPDNDLWYVIGEDTEQFSWGKGKVYYHEKIAMP
ncbi:hypothetical protein ScalyP_jg3142 [Parmales sp. scaly parma]|nr:hypothetical protein ScalyP_jg3142 [Parmales sp. scaly parma]